MLKGLLIGLVIILIVVVNVTNHNRAPNQANEFLQSQGYQKINLQGTMLFGSLDFCSKGVVRVKFAAIKDSRPVSGYVCVEPVFKNYIHLN